MNPLPSFAIYIAVASFFLVGFLARLRNLSTKLAQSQLDAARLRRHMERLEMVLKQAEPELFAHVKARSDMEWQQAVARLKDGELPTFFPLETSFEPISSLNSTE